MARIVCRGYDSIVTLSVLALLSLHGNQSQRCGAPEPVPGMR